MEFLPKRDGLLHVSELLEGESLADFELDEEIDVTLADVSPLITNSDWLSTKPCSKLLDWHARSALNLLVKGESGTRTICSSNSIKVFRLNTALSSSFDRAESALDPDSALQRGKVFLTRSLSLNQAV